MKNKVITLLGFAQKSGKVLSGEYMVLEALKKGKAKIVLLAVDTSENTKKRISDKCSFRNINCYEVLTKDEMSQAIGKEARVAVAITDNNFAKSIEKNLGGEAFV